MIEYLPNWIGYVRSIGLIPQESDSTIEGRLKKFGVYDEKLATFQSSIVSSTEEEISGLSLPPAVGREWLIEKSVKSATDYLRKRPEVAKSLKPKSFTEASGQCLRSLKVLFEDYSRLLRSMEQNDIDLLIRSDMPPTYFNDSILAYRTIVSYLGNEYQHIADFVNRRLVIYRSNQPKLKRAVDGMKSTFELDAEPLKQLLLHQGRLRLFVNAWNSSDPQEVFNPKTLSLDKLDKGTYDQLYKLFKVNLSLFTRRIRGPNQKLDRMTETMWRGLIEPLAAR